MVSWLSYISPLHTCHRKEKIILDVHQAERNYEMPMEIYEGAIACAH